MREKTKANLLQWAAVEAVIVVGVGWWILADETRTQAAHGWLRKALALLIG